MATKLTKRDIQLKGLEIIPIKQIIMKDGREISTYPVRTAKGKYLQPKIVRSSNGRKKEYVAYSFGRVSISAGRLFYAWFNGTIDANMDIDHIDNNPFNNTIENLQQLTHKENCKKKFLDDPENLEIYTRVCKWMSYCKYCKSLELPKEIL